MAILHPPFDDQNARNQNAVAVTIGQSADQPKPLHPDNANSHRVRLGTGGTTGWADEAPERSELTVHTHRAQHQVPEGTWQSSDTHYGTSTVLDVQPPKE